MPRRLILAVAVLLLAMPSTAQAAKRQLYVSLGDSYAAGYEATAAGQGTTTRNGFAYQLVEQARTRGHRLKLVNFACGRLPSGGGETSSTILARKAACPLPAPGGERYAGRTQAAAAVRFLRRHRGKVTLITVSIGGNDVTSCVNEADPVACAGPAIDRVEANGAKLLKRLRKAAGKKTRIVGITYPDVILGEWVHGNRDLAGLSVIAFKDLLNPALKQMYESVGGRFVDVTGASGAYGSLDETTTLAPYGEIPVPVARVCELTYYCAYRDIHANADGYELIARLIARTLPRKH